ncbi:acyl-CoA-binding protein [Neisseria arctica]|uniref:Acyl-CoA-binding protein n=1 Tax=Neisseria arctica TaxID=1470200 RepID=A0A0J0YSI1_9NEIS|nr:acyl-CoA-binding protein [Neisseria arctica]KLT73047.1 acyl-CoA-binding protein [Neisseria arctica]UOO86765.1 acyl-CoA-binding protein [Neisseria arctica]
MSDLKQQFEQAQADVVSLAERPDNATLLKLYSLYKQATEGDVKGDKPGMFDLVAKKKYEAWSNLQGMSSEDAMKGYIAEVERLLNEE